MVGKAQHDGQPIGSKLFVTRIRCQITEISKAQNEGQAIGIGCNHRKKHGTLNLCEMNWIQVVCDETTMLDHAVSLERAKIMARQFNCQLGTYRKKHGT